MQGSKSQESHPSSIPKLITAISPCTRFLGPCVCRGLACSWDGCENDYIHVYYIHVCLMLNTLLHA